MFNKTKALFARFRSNDEGATLVEYGIALGLAIALGGGALLALSGEVGDSMTAAGSALPDAPAAATTTTTTTTP